MSNFQTFKLSNLQTNSSIGRLVKVRYTNSNGATSALTTVTSTVRLGRATVTRSTVVSQQTQLSLVGTGFTTSSSVTLGTLRLPYPTTTRRLPDDYPTYFCPFQPYSPYPTPNTPTQPGRNPTPS